MSHVFLSENAHGVLKQYLLDRGHTMIEIRPTAIIPGAVSAHGDLYLCNICGELILAPEQFQRDPTGSKTILSCSGPIISYLWGESSLGPAYPLNAAYNAACFGEFFIHNLNFTDPAIRRKAEEKGLTMIHVKQGYTKCNIVTVDERSIITSDHGIARAAGRHGIQVLLISAGHVSLEGFPYGFLGGASGRVGNSILFNGTLAQHPDRAAILDFIGSRGLETVCFEDHPLEDIGSIIEF